MNIYEMDRTKKTFKMRDKRSIIEENVYNYYWAKKKISVSKMKISYSNQRKRDCIEFI